MPASLLSEMTSNGVNSIEDQRALQLALELTMLGLGNGEDCVDGSAVLNGTNAFLEAEKVRKSANMTECVPVPSSEHVAEIVGRQGCKIKALRAKTNTYIKTPVRGEEPVFVVTGRKEDVTLAKREILSAAEHFSQIRASRRNNAANQLTGTGTSLAPGPPSPNAPGQVTIQVRVPYRVVGLVVGPKGATIKRIQQATHTYIVTPSRDKEPVFEVTGTPENVEKARHQIESHIAMRTGGVMDGDKPGVLDGNDFHVNGIDAGFHDATNHDLLGLLGKSQLSTVTYNNFNTALNALNGISNNYLPNHNQENAMFSFSNINGNSSGKISDFLPPANGFGIYDQDEGFASPSFHTSPIATNLWTSDANDSGIGVSLFGTTSTTTTALPRRSNSFGETTSRVSPPLNTDATNGTMPHTSVRRMGSDPLNGITFTANNNVSYATTSSSMANGCAASPICSSGSPKKCVMCSSGSPVSNAVLCAHHVFCIECASHFPKKPESNDQLCPMCG